MCPDSVRRLPAPAGRRLTVALVVGIVTGAGLAIAGRADLGPLLGWDLAAIVYCGWTWASAWTLDAADTARAVGREDPSRAVADVLLLAAAVTSLIAVAFVLAGSSNGSGKGLAIPLAVASVVVSWTTVHTIFTSRYARLYYRGSAGGIDFNQEEPPQFSDFAYLAFTIGMTFQASDTDIEHRDIRATALRHALLSYVFGAVIIATTINLVANLAK
jgi:uncharacterized membrane protein